MDPADQTLPHVASPPIVAAVDYRSRPAAAPPPRPFLHRPIKAWNVIEWLFVIFWAVAGFIVFSIVLICLIVSYAGPTVDR